MGRSLYAFLLRLHPRGFRERFGDEMMGIYDEAERTGGARGFIADGLVSLARQWAFRPEPGELSTAAARSDGVPLFYTCADSMPRTGALLNGVVLSIAAFAAVSLAIGHWRARNAIVVPFTAAHYRTGLSSRQAPAQRTTEATFSSEPPAAKRTLLRADPAVYARAVPVVGAMDTDGDGVLSQGELSGAPDRLLALDKNADGKLSPEEWGLGGSSKSGPVDFTKKLILSLVAQPRGVESAETPVRSREADCVRIFEVLAALDVNRDGVISSEEIRKAPASLKRLDRNGDGRLTGGELFPDAVCSQ